MSVIVHYLTVPARREALFSPAPGVFPFVLQRRIFVVRVDSPDQFNQPISHLEKGVIFTQEKMLTLFAYSSHWRILTLHRIIDVKSLRICTVIYIFVNL